MMKEPKSFKHRTSVTQLSSVIAMLTSSWGLSYSSFLQCTVMCPGPTPGPCALLHLRLVLRTHVDKYYMPHPQFPFQCC